VDVPGTDRAVDATAGGVKAILEVEKVAEGVMGPQISLPSSVMAPAVSLRTPVVLVLVREVEMVEGIHALATEAADKLAQ
jgi:hypothetical protein